MSVVRKWGRVDDLVYGDPEVEAARTAFSDSPPSSSSHGEDCFQSLLPFTVPEEKSDSGYTGHKRLLCCSSTAKGVYLCTTQLPTGVTQL